MTTDDLHRVRSSYDAVADRYAEVYADELDRNPMHRGLVAWFLEMVADARGGDAPVADLGCGPGHIAGALAAAGLPTIGVDLSPAMIAVARRRHPAIDFTVGDLTDLGVEAAWAGAAAMYSIIHLSPAQRARAYASIARALRPGAWLLLTFHVEMGEHRPGATLTMDTWWERPVDLDAHFLDPEEVIAGLAAVGLETQARVEREHWPGAEVASRRAALLARRRRDP
ncbi:MAG: class I SAM-dependent methyltransferase [Nannocystaceae bacterium]